LFFIFSITYLSEKLPLKEKAIFNWSGGKDSAFCLYKILQMQQYDIICLLTTLSERYRRISMHGVRESLLSKQAESMGIPLYKIQLSEMPSMEDYETAMTNALIDLKSKGASVSVFGDIFLEDLRAYREKKLAEKGLNGIFPLWKIPTDLLIREFIDKGFKAIITCVNEKYLDKSFAGRIIDDHLLSDLPPDVDPCGENGEYHSFVFDGPIFNQPIPFKKGEIVYKRYAPATQNNNSITGNYIGMKDTEQDPFDSGFWYCDLI
jgi:uncharacterized protein (TIGR00290 family)